jgi:fucose 4-O-acetylase-like acetyltransferase
MAEHQKNTKVDEHSPSPILNMEVDKVQARNLWVDYAKAIGIILVVYGHVERGIFQAGLKINQSIYELADSVIYSFHMPLFFFLSGIFLISSMAKRDSISLLRGKVDTILYPYVIWSLLQGMIEVVLTHYTNGHTTAIEVLSLAWSPRAQFWFLYVLFFVFSLAILIYRQSGFAWCTGIFIGSIFLYFFGSLLPDVYLINMLVYNFIYFAAGVFTTFLLAKFNCNNTKWFFLSAVLFIFSQWLFHIEMGLRYNTGTASETLLLGLISIGFIIFLAHWLTRFNLRWLAYLGQQSMTIYLVHILAGSGCRIVLLKVFGISSVGIHLLIGTLGGLLLPLLFYIGCVRFGLSALFRPPKVLSVGSQYQQGLRQRQSDQ